MIVQLQHPIRKNFNFLILLFLILPGKSAAQDIFEACRQGDTSRIAFLFKLRPDTIHSKNEAGFTPLIIAVYRNQIKASAYLLKCGVNVNASSPEGPALLAAVYKNNFELVELLIRCRANPDVKNEDGVTALMMAAMNNNSGIAEFLLTHGADKTLVSKSGHTALSYACIYNFTNIQQLLSK